MALETKEPSLSRHQAPAAVFLTSLQLGTTTQPKTTPHARRFGIPIGRLAALPPSSRVQVRWRVSSPYRLQVSRETAIDHPPRLACCEGEGCDTRDVLAIWIHCEMGAARLNCRLRLSETPRVPIATRHGVPGAAGLRAMPVEWAGWVTPSVPRETTAIPNLVTLTREAEYRGDGSPRTPEAYSSKVDPYLNPAGVPPPELRNNKGGFHVKQTEIR